MRHAVVIAALTLVACCSNGASADDQGLLKQCWTSSALAGTEQELRSSRPPFHLDLPALKQVALPAVTPVPPELRGSIRGVELPPGQKLIALTFDAGANADGVPAIRRTLRAKEVRATFFLTGNFVRRFPRKSARLGREYLIGNHSLTHADLTKLSDFAVRRQVRLAESAILGATGQDPRRFFRFPYGASSGHAIGLLNSLCYVPFRWTVDTLGWKGTSSGMTARKVVNRVLAAASPGAIVLMHVGSNPDDGSTLDADALPAVIDRLRAQGYTLVRLSRVMSAAP